LNLIALTVMPIVAAETRETIVVGTHAAPPFVLENPNGTLSGISIELWKEIADDLGLDYEIGTMEIAQLLKGLQDGTLDVVAGALTVTAKRIQRVDFSHPFYTSGLAIALVEDRCGRKSMPRFSSIWHATNGRSCCRGISAIAFWTIFESLY
jgi:polar amino acid transport system substrate-binding protein